MKSPDQAYYRGRQDLLVYEDSELYRLLSLVPDYYVSRTDNTLSGRMLRAVASELGRQEYQHAYDLMSKDPNYLTPVDARRQLADALFIPREYPKASQSDLEYQTMLIALVKAFQQGATIDSLVAVIRAYIGNTLSIEEAFKKIGTQGYSASDRNMLRVTTQIGDTTSANGVKTLTENLYAALDLAKPAHVGLSLNAMFAEGDAFTETLSDELQIIVWFLEGVPGETPLYLYSEDGIKPANIPETHIGPTAMGHTLVNITLSGLGTRTGGSWTSPLLEGAVIKVGAQTDSRQNGYYTAKTGSWTRFNAVGGIVSPILNRVWEMEDEDPVILDME